MKYAIIVENLCDWTLVSLVGSKYAFFQAVKVVKTTEKSSFIEGERRWMLATRLRHISNKQAFEIIKTNYYRFNKLAVDFDCTLASMPREWPEIGKQKLIHKFVAWYVNYKHKQGWIIILNTLRNNEKGLQDVIDYCNNHRIHTDLINTNLQTDIDKFGESRKIGCTRSIDDTQIGLLGWLLRTFS